MTDEMTRRAAEVIGVIRDIAPRERRSDCTAGDEYHRDIYGNEQACTQCVEREWVERIADLIRGYSTQAWSEGFATGQSRAMRHMSDEPLLPLSASNPYEKSER